MDISHVIALFIDALTSSPLQGTEIVKIASINIETDDNKSFHMEYGHEGEDLNEQEKIEETK